MGCDTGGATGSRRDFSVSSSSAAGGAGALSLPPAVGAASFVSSSSEDVVTRRALPLEAFFIGVGSTSDSATSSLDV